MSYSRKTTSQAINTGAASLESGRARVHSLALLCILAVACFSLLLFVTLPTTSLAWSSVQNAGHFFLFSALAIVYIVQIDKILNWTFLAKAILTLVTLTIIGILAEIAQTYLPARNASSEDLWRNFAGVSTGLIAYGCYRYRTGLSNSILILCMLLLVSISLLVCRSAIELLGYAVLKSESPTIVSFSDPFVKSMISTTGGAKTTLATLKSKADTPQQRTLRMDFAQQPYSGVIMHEPEIQWTDSTNMALHIFNADSQSRTLELRIHDAVHNNLYEDRFNTNFHVKPGENEVLIPVETIQALGGNSNKRSMDMQKISELQLFSSSREAFTLYLMDIILAQE